MWMENSHKALYDRRARIFDVICQNAVEAAEETQARFDLDRKRRLAMQQDDDDDH